jgi:hypothetical protein
MNDLKSTLVEIDRRSFLSLRAAGLGSLALADLKAAENAPQRRTHHEPRAKRVIYLFQSG